MGCLTVFVRLLSEALLTRAVAKIVDSLFNQGKLYQWAKQVFAFVLGLFRRR
jgi:hypothetical protein